MAWEGVREMANGYETIYARELQTRSRLEKIKVDVDNNGNFWVMLKDTAGNVVTIELPRHDGAALREAIGEELDNNG